MKKNLFFLVLVILTATFGYGQTVPKGIAYQAVAINTEAQSVAGVNPENTYWSNKDIQVRFTIYDQYPGGTAQMVETHQTKTNKFGVFNVIIGQGQNESGDLFDVDWDKGQAHLKVEIDFNNNGLYKLVGIERFWSVPYALNSAGSTSGGGSGPDLSKKLDSLADALNKQIADFRNQINGLNQGDTSSDNELQELELDGNELGLSKSNKTVDISTILKDNDVNNELQSIRLSNDSLILSINNSGIKLPEDKVYDGDSSIENEVQHLFLKNDSIKLTKSDKSIPITYILELMDSLRYDTINYYTDTFFMLNKNAIFYGNTDYTRNKGSWTKTVTLDSFDLHKGCAMDIGLATRLYSWSNNETSSVQFYICDKEDKRVRLRLDNNTISTALGQSHTRTNSSPSYSNANRDLFCFIPKSGRYYLRAILTVVHKERTSTYGSASITLNSCTIQD